jgi:hypothetical protein
VSKKIVLLVVIALILTLVAGAVSAQEQQGSIRGTVYQDLNGDGKCVNTGEPILVGTPIKFVSNDGKTTLYLQSGENGTYGLVAAGFGTWTVTADPNNEWAVTSMNPIEVFLGSEQLLVLGVDFCVAKVGTVPPQTVLPESGAAIAPLLMVVMTVGAGLSVAGIGLEVRRRRSAG